MMDKRVTSNKSSSVSNCVNEHGCSISIDWLGGVRALSQRVQLDDQSIDIDLTFDGVSSLQPTTLYS